MDLENGTQHGDTPDAKFWGFYGTIVVLFVASIYLLASITAFVILQALTKRNRMALARSLSTNVVRREQSKNMRTCKRIMISLCLTISIFSVAQFSIQQVLLFKAELLVGPVRLAYKYVEGIQIVLGYIFLWFRQRVFYSGSSLLANVLRNNKILQRFSTLSIVFAMANVVVQLFLTWYWNEVSDGFYEAVTWTIMCFFVQGSLLVLFFYPLLKHKREQKRYLSNSISRNEPRNPARSLQRLIRRCLFVTVISFATDLIPILLLVFYEVAFGTGLPKLWVFLLRDFNSVINLVCFVATFQNWKKMLGPWQESESRELQNTVTENSRTTVLSISSGRSQPTPE
ncbi:uncharacterized protein LOC143458885 [Clavelina lepadiformis]|uniref:G-protein coupled receptors family 1 profile domain-containing protein n=1 Tax=Clavelina lepadiformis TaxID=159417 RepID=A0ABP0FRI4_CLALP